MPLFLGERRAVGWWSLRLALPLGLVVFAESAAPARPLLAVARPPVVIEPSRVVPRPAGALITLEPLTIQPSRHPLDGLSAVEIEALVRTAPEKLGPAIIGRSNRGALANPVTLEPGAGIEVMNTQRNFATEVTVSSLRAAVLEVEREFPGSVLRVGDISARRGGYIRPHRSHQAGVDVDIGFYYRAPEKWYTKANASNLDCAKTWTLLKALVAQGTLEYVFVDRSVQVLLRDYALGIGESREFLDALFENPAKKDSLVRHRWGHLTHFHARFIDPVAEETGRRAGMRLKQLRAR